MDEKKQIVIHFEQFESDSKCPFTQHQLQIRLVERELLNDPECEVHPLKLSL
jgi:hypothetical protein